jgi:hypothetical protein
MNPLYDETPTFKHSAQVDSLTPINISPKRRAPLGKQFNMTATGNFMARPLLPQTLMTPNTSIQNQLKDVE